MGHVNKHVAHLSLIGAAIKIKPEAGEKMDENLIQFTKRGCQPFSTTTILDVHASDIAQLITHQLLPRGYSDLV